MRMLHFAETEKSYSDFNTFGYFLPKSIDDSKYYLSRSKTQCVTKLLLKSAIHLKLLNT